MKIKSIGWDLNPLTSQMPQINKAFEDCGYTLIVDGPIDLIYTHCSSHYDLGIHYKNRYPDATLMLKCLDIPLHCIENGTYNLEENRRKLLKADKILANSETVKKHIKKYFNLNSHVIYDIPKPVFQRDIPWKERTIDILGGGRLRDSNKRGQIFNVLEKYTNKTIVTFGPESINNKNHCGLVSDSQLNELYSQTKFVLCPSVVEGINLLGIESVLAGRFPIVNEKMTTSAEFWPKEFHCCITLECIQEKMQEIENNLDFYTNLLQEHKKTIAEKFSPKSVINNIIKAYQPF